MKWYLSFVVSYIHTDVVSLQHFFHNIEGAYDARIMKGGESTRDILRIWLCGLLLDLFSAVPTRYSSAIIVSHLADVDAFSSGKGVVAISLHSAEAARSCAFTAATTIINNGAKKRE